MKHYLRCRRWYVFVGLVGISTIMLAGCPIDLTGKEGPAGPAGTGRRGRIRGTGGSRCRRSTARHGGYDY